MNFAQIELSPEEQAFADEIRSLLLHHWDPDQAPLALDHHRPSPELRKSLGARGLLYPDLPVEEGGAGLSPIRRHILESLIVSLRIPNPFDRLIRPVLAKFGSDRLKHDVLPQLTSGLATVCLGYSEADSGSDMAAARTRAVLDGDTWTINGAKIYTTYAHESDYVFLLARTNNEASKHRGLTMFLVPLSLPGVEVRALHAMSDVRTNMTSYQDVKVPDWYRVGPVDSGWMVVSEPLAAEHGVEGSGSGLGPINGTMGAMFAATLDELVSIACEWATTPTNTGGRRRSADPTVRARLAKLVLDTELVKNYPSELGKVAGGEALMKHSDTISDLVGLEGALDTATPHRYQWAFHWTRGYAQGTAIYGGTKEIWKNNYARSTLGLPRPK